MISGCFARISRRRFAWGSCASRGREEPSGTRYAFGWSRARSENVVDEKASFSFLRRKGADDDGVMWMTMTRDSSVRNGRAPNARRGSVRACAREGDAARHARGRGTPARPTSGRRGHDTTSCGALVPHGAPRGRLARARDGQTGHRLCHAVRATRRRRRTEAGKRDAPHLCSSRSRRISSAQGLRSTWRGAGSRNRGARASARARGGADDHPRLRDIHSTHRRPAASKTAVTVVWRAVTAV